MSLEDKYLDLTDDQIDNLLLGVDLDQTTPNITIPIDDKLTCISCKSDKLIIDNAKGYLVCQECAVINEEFLDKNQEFSNDANGTSRYGCPSNYFFPKSALGTKINARGYNRAAILQRQGQMPYKEKSLLEVLERIQSKCKKYNLTQTIIDSAKILYKKVSDCKHTKGKRKGKNMIMRCINRRSMIAACLFYACKLQKEPRSPKEVADIYDLEIKHVNRGCRKFIDYIDLSTIFYEVKSSQSSDFIERFAKKLNIDKQYITIIKDISSNIHKLGLASTHEPPSVAAGCILLVANMYHVDINKKQISDIFGISDVTISKTYRKIYPYHKIIMNNKVTDMILEKKNNSQKQPFLQSEESLVSSDKNSSELTEDTDDSESEEYDLEV
uniref:Transcription factor TFIIB cyclin-like domain-containing protein n=1 Tax=viral metagenome TaxID=1070528 RepID=A0A6C0DC07_9ZZZZ